MEAASPLSNECRNIIIIIIIFYRTFKKKLRLTIELKIKSFKLILNIRNILIRAAVNRDKLI